MSQAVLFLVDNFWLTHAVKNIKIFKMGGISKLKFEERLCMIIANSFLACVNQ